MSLASLRYKLPEESRDFLDAYNGHKWRSVVEEVLESIRRRLKYEDHPENVDIMLEAIRTEICGLLDGECLQLWE